MIKPGETSIKPKESQVMFDLYDKVDQERKRATEEKESRLQAVVDLEAPTGKTMTPIKMHLTALY